MRLGMPRHEVGGVTHWFASSACRCKLDAAAVDHTRYGKSTKSRYVVCLSNAVG